MPSQFYPIRIKDIRSETENSASIIFDIPAELQDTFRYKSGQYITLKVSIDGKSYNRAYSLGSSPFVDQYPFVTIKKTEYGFVSRYIIEKLKIGDTVHLMPPLGNFTIETNSNSQRLIIMFGGGSGIIPLFSLTKTIISQEPRSNIVLYYANRNDKNVIYELELKKLAEQSGARFRIVYFFETPSDRIDAHTGNITVEYMHNLLAEIYNKDSHSAQFFICGPAQMMQLIENVLASEGVAGSQIHREQFVAQHDPPAELAPAPPKEREICVFLYGKKYQISVATGATILEAAIDQNLDPPYACQVAACCTCRAKLLTGNVHMDNREALTDEELDDGYILTCQSHPISDDVVVDYDQ